MSDAAVTLPALDVSVWFDVRCPWCFIGKRRLERAVDLFHEESPDVPITVRHHSFELAPGIADRFEGDEAEYLKQYEGVPLEQSERTLPALEELAVSEGVPIEFAGLKHVNTRRAHRVFQYGQAQGKGEELLDRLFTAYFSEHLDFSQPAILADLAAEVGLDWAAALEAADTEEWDDRIRTDHTRAEMLGSGGVPFALVNAKYSVSGAQADTVFAAVFREVVKREFGETGSPGEE